jgi:hypothetical protein
MLFAASANDFAMLFVSIELITITFYVLVSFQRSKLQSLEAGVKYLILGALSSAFMMFGIALIWGTTGELNFHQAGRRRAAVCGQQNFPARRAAGAGRARLQDRGVSVSDLGAGCLSRRADADDRVSRHRFQGGWFCPAAARAVHRRAERDGALGKPAHRHFRASRFSTAISARCRSGTSSACSAIPALRTRAICCSAWRR